MKTNLLPLLLIGLSICSSTLSQSPFLSFPQSPEYEVLNPKADENWEFVKDRLFDGSTDNVKKYISDIRIKLDGNPTYEDSIIINELIGELKNIIKTVDVRLVKEKGNLVLTFLNHPDVKLYGEKSVIGIGNNYEIVKNARNEKRRSENYRQIFARFDTLENDYSAIALSFNNSISYYDRKTFIEYYIVQSLCIVNEKSYKYRNITNKGPILGKSYFDQDPLDTQFDQKDKFLLSKLYSVDFQKQFKDYVIKSYSKLYYWNFVNKGMIKSLALSSVIIITILILILAYRLVFRHNFRIQYLNYLFPTLVITLTFYLIQYIYMVITLSPHMAGGILYVLILTTAVTLISSVLYFLIEKLIVRPKLKGQARLILQVSLLFVFVLFPCYYLFRYTVESSAMFLTFISLAVIISIGRGILLYIKYSEDLLVRVKDSEITKLKELKAKAEVQSLHSRINPHFLYNSLNSIAGLAHSNPDKTEKMALSLSDLFRYSINRKDELMSSVKDEVDMVHSYLEIEQIRFGERLKFKIEVDKTLENVSIPRFILQPLVENAIKHGVSKIEGEGVISIYIMKLEENLLITVLDNGPAFPEGLVSGYGLQSLYDLLKLTYGERAEVNWRNDPEKFIRVTIPILL